MNSRFGHWGGLRLGFGSSRVPVILQTEGAECGLACLAMVANHTVAEPDSPDVHCTLMTRAPL